MGADEAVERVGQLDGEGVERGRGDASSVDGDLLGAHAADAGQGLGVEQDEQTGDSAVEADRVVVQEQLDVRPPAFVGEGDGGLGCGTGGCG